MEKPFSTLRTHLYLGLVFRCLYCISSCSTFEITKRYENCESFNRLITGILVYRTCIKLSIAWLQEYFGIRLVLNILHLCKSYEFFMTKVLMIETYVFLIPIKYFWYLHVTMYFWLAKKMMYWDLHLYLRSTYIGT